MQIVRQEVWIAGCSVTELLLGTQNRSFLSTEMGVKVNLPQFNKKYQRCMKIWVFHRHTFIIILLISDVTLFSQRGYVDFLISSKIYVWKINRECGNVFKKKNKNLKIIFIQYNIICSFCTVRYLFWIFDTSDSIF